MPLYRGGSSSRTFLLVVLSVCVLLSAGCSPSVDELNPHHYPYRLELVRDDDAAEYVDLDGDGRDERILYAARHTVEGTATDSINALTLQTFEKRNIDQVNFAGTIGEAHFVDFEDDGKLEILVPLIRGDSLFLHVVDHQGRKQGRFFVATGGPRVEPEGTLPWDPFVRSVYLADVTGDMRPELITHVNTRYARRPRGVFVHDIDRRVLLGKCLVGAAIITTVLENADGDEYPELLFASVAPNNGAEAGGMDDQHSYVGAFELSPSPRVQWQHEMGGRWTVAWLMVGHLDDDGTTDFLTYKWTKYSRPDRAPLQIIDPASGETNRNIALDIPLRDAVATNLDGDARSELIVIDRQGTVKVFDHRLDVVRTRSFGDHADELQTIPDMNGDGTEELLVRVGERHLFLDDELNIRAVASGTGKWGVVNRGVGQAPFVYVRSTEKRSSVFRVVDNPYYLAYRYGPEAAGILGAGLLLVIAIAGRRLVSRHEEVRAQKDQLLRTDERGTLLLRPEKEIEEVNEPARVALGLNGRPATWEGIREKAPQLMDFIEIAMSDPFREHRRTITTGENGASTICRVTASPAWDEHGTVVRWIVRLDEKAEGADLDDYRAWGIMARRLAHDLKNPLTGILITLQHLQMEYEEVAPSATEELDPYVGRIEDRIEHLRRMTTNFLKFVNLEESLPIATDLNGFVRERVATLHADLPSDIELRLKLEEDLPAARLDPDQMTSVLENLVANAVEAMPKGGRLTIATYAVRDVQFEAGMLPEDYVVVEIRDTGVGMSEAVRARLFEPGFTTVEDGTGLGLAIVRKVIEDHGGRIEVESEPGDGSVFGVYLPAEPGRAEPGSARRPEREADTRQ